MYYMAVLTLWELRNQGLCKMRYETSYTYSCSIANHFSQGMAIVMAIEGKQITLKAVLYTS